MAKRYDRPHPKQGLESRRHLNSAARLLRDSDNVITHAKQSVADSKRLISDGPTRRKKADAKKTENS
jgi:hypothetical protein